MRPGFDHQQPTFPVKRYLLKNIVIALAWALIHTLIVCLMIDPSSIPNGYASLRHWDTSYFIDIARTGYGDLSEPLEPRAAFFPLLPLISYGLHAITTWDVQYTTPLASQLSYAGMIFYLLLFAQRAQATPAATALGIGVFASQPGSFHLVVGYSESLMLFNLLGYIFWSTLPGRMPILIAAIHGLGLTLSRYFGLAFIVYPFAYWLFVHREHFVRYLALAATPALGTLSYFAYLYATTNQVDFYFAMQKKHWCITPDYFFFDKLALYRKGWLSLQQLALEHQKLDVNFIAEIYWLVLLLLASYIAIAYRHQREFIARLLPECAAILAITYICYAATYNHAYQSMYRFLLVPNMLLLLAWFRAPSLAAAKFRFAIYLALVALMLGQFFVQSTLAWRFGQALPVG